MADLKPPVMSMAAGVIALRGARIFLDAGRAAVERRSQQVEETGKRKKSTPQKKPSPKTIEMLLKTTRYSKIELEALYTMYRDLVASGQSALPYVIGAPPPKSEGIDQNTFRDVMHNIFNLVTEETLLERIWVTWDRGAAGGEGALKFEAWVRGLNVMLRGNLEERMHYCFGVYDLNADGFISKDEIFSLLKNSLLKQPGDEDPDEGVKDLVELVLKKMDLDRDGKISYEDYQKTVEQEPLLLEAFGQCLPTRQHSAAFLRTIIHTSNARTR